MQRRAEFRPFSWLHDLWKRDQLDLSPPYQRRSVWPERFRSDFITTVLLNYPCPAVFLYEEIKPDGSFLYKVVDGKQRLTTLFDFVSDKIMVSEEHPGMALRGQSFSALDDNVKLNVWRYAFSVEFIEQENEAVINDIFNRINKNVAKLTQQELRHAIFSGIFISETERLAGEIEEILPSRFPNIAPQSMRQMKDVENVAVMLLFIENGERSLSQADLDKAFGEREEEWAGQAATVAAFQAAIRFIAQIVDGPGANAILTSRLRNQADFYSLFAAVVELQREGNCPSPADAAANLTAWLNNLRGVERGEAGADQITDESRYLDAARAASNDSGPRRTRINIIKAILTGL
ncbi:DUF262 domain-containing protein [Aurantimonas marina]|uniref:DUF262 domain-containing protein n=1 Tax=Aurantimonas marina TaxID=2780508 RepID=UPI0019D22B1F|nr:DUF262 domain-containing protein [Aurantimonas marina]